MPLLSTASAVTAPSATPSRSVSPRRSTRAPSQNASAKQAISAASGLTEDDTKTAIGCMPDEHSARELQGPTGAGELADQQPRGGRGDEQKHD